MTVIQIIQQVCKGIVFGPIGTIRVKMPLAGLYNSAVIIKLSPKLALIAQSVFLIRTRDGVFLVFNGFVPH